jgi:hypothetical protein
MWVFRGKVYFVNNNKLYSRSSGNEGTLIHTFESFTLFDTAAVKIWEEFGTDFIADFEYRATEILVGGLEHLFITNGIDTVLVGRDGSATIGPQSFNRFTANSFYKPGDKVIPSSYALKSGYYYIVIGEAGIATQASTEPTWPTVLGQTVTTDNVTFMCYAVATRSTVAEVYTDRAYVENDLVQPATESGLYYKCIRDGTTTGEPTWTQIKGDTSTQNGVVFECMGYYGGKPGLHIPAPVYLDTYLVLVPYRSSDVYHSDPNDPYSWKATNFISADSFTSPIRAVARYNNYIVTFSDKDAELFYNNANQDGSTLSRHESFILQVGCYSQKAIIGTETILAWIGVSSSGAGAVWMLDGFEPKEIGTTWINRIVADNNSSPIYNSSFSMRISGHLLLVFNMSYNTLVFDIGLNVWYHWGTYGINSFEVLSSFPFDYYAYDPSYGQETNYLMSRTEKELFNIEWYNYTDYIPTYSTEESCPIVLKVMTPPIDFENRKTKFLHSLDIIGDLVDETDTNGATVPEDWMSEMQITWTNKDWKDLDPVDLWFSPETLEQGFFTVDLRTRPRIAPCGSFRRRAFWMSYSGPFRLRLEALDLNFTQGTH